MSLIFILTNSLIFNEADFDLVFSSKVHYGLNVSVGSLHIAKRRDSQSKLSSHNFDFCETEDWIEIVDKRHSLLYATCQNTSMALPYEKIGLKGFKWNKRYNTLTILNGAFSQHNAVCLHIDLSQQLLYASFDSIRKKDIYNCHLYKYNNRYITIDANILYSSSFMNDFHINSPSNYIFKYWPTICSKLSKIFDNKLEQPFTMISGFKFIRPIEFWLDFCNIHSAVIIYQWKYMEYPNPHINSNHHNSECTIQRVTGLNTPNISISDVICIEDVIDRASSSDVVQYVSSASLSMLTDNESIRSGAADISDIINCNISCTMNTLVKEEEFQIHSVLQAFLNSNKKHLIISDIWGSHGLMNPIEIEFNTNLRKLFVSLATSYDAMSWHSVLDALHIETKQATVVLGIQVTNSLLISALKSSFGSFDASSCRGYCSEAAVVSSTPPYWCTSADAINHLSTVIADSNSKENEASTATTTTSTLELLLQSLKETVAQSTVSLQAPQKPRVSVRSSQSDEVKRVLTSAPPKSSTLTTSISTARTTTCTPPSHPNLRVSKQHTYVLIFIPKDDMKSARELLQGWKENCNLCSLYSTYVIIERPNICKLFYDYHNNNSNNNNNNNNDNMNHDPQSMDFNQQHYYNNHNHYSYHIDSYPECTVRASLLELSTYIGFTSMKHDLYIVLRGLSAARGFRAPGSATGVIPQCDYGKDANYRLFAPVVYATSTSTSKSVTQISSMCAANINCINLISNAKNRYCHKLCRKSANNDFQLDFRAFAGTAPALRRMIRNLTIDPVYPYSDIGVRCAMINYFRSHVEEVAVDIDQLLFNLDQAPTVAGGSTYAQPTVRYDAPVRQNKNTSLFMKFMTNLTPDDILEINVSITIACFGLVRVILR